MRNKKRKNRQGDDESIDLEVKKGRLLQLARVELAEKALSCAKVFVEDVSKRKKTYLFEYKGARITSTMPKSEWIERYEQCRR